jgi:hypothetical protein
MVSIGLYAGADTRVNRHEVRQFGLLQALHLLGRTGRPTEADVSFPRLRTTPEPAAAVAVYTGVGGQDQKAPRASSPEN